MRIDIVEMGAKPNANTVCTGILQQAIDQCHNEGGGIVQIPAGRFLTGSIQLKSNTHLFFEPGAVLVMNQDANSYPVVDANWEGRPQPCHTPCIYASGAHNIGISGQGRIEGGGMFWWEPFRQGKLDAARPTLIGLHNCRDITLRDITLANSPSWTVHPLRCDNLTIDGIIIINPADSPNTDGINPDSCNNVRISNCHIDVGDDCIALKAGTEATQDLRPCENITITNCTMVHGHGGVVIGSEMSGSVRNVVISNCVFDGTDRGIRIKTRRGRGGTVEDVLASNIIIRNTFCPVVLNTRYFCGFGGKDAVVADLSPQPVTQATPQIRNIHLQNITVLDCHGAAAYILGLPEAPVQNITLSHLRVRFAKNTTPQQPAMALGVEKMQRRGITASYANNLRLDAITLSGQEGEEYILDHCAAFSG